MSWLVPIHAAGGLVLALAGSAKLRRPAPTAAAMRAIGLPSHPGVVGAVGALEVVLGLTAALGVPWVAWLVGLQWLALAVVATLLVRRPHVPCGCFGEEVPVPVTAAHVAVDIAFAAVAFTVGSLTEASLVEASAGARGGPAVVLALVCVFALLVRGLLTDLPGLRVAVREARA